jgi:large subunit ribosomal protein L29
MKKTSLKDLKDTDIASQLAQASKELREHRFQFAVTRSLENPMIIRNLRKKVARLLTIQNERKKKARA